MGDGRVLDPRLIWLLREPRKGGMSEGPGLFRDNEDGFGVLMMSWAPHHTVCKRTVRLRGPQNRGEPWIS